jgi:predicted RNA-binding Zn-ribbon protein involved in translation (DUF1610 family)
VTPFPHCLRLAPRTDRGPLRCTACPAWTYADDLDEMPCPACGAPMKREEEGMDLPEGKDLGRRVQQAACDHEWADEMGFFFMCTKCGYKDNEWSDD